MAHTTTFGAVQSSENLQQTETQYENEKMYPLMKCKTQTKVHNRMTPILTVGACSLKQRLPQGIKFDAFSLVKYYLDEASAVYFKNLLIHQCFFIEEPLYLFFAVFSLNRYN